jgi:hypothetical protein
MQTTVNNLKDLFMGNPGALQQTMQREQQAKPGVPPDLLKMIALQEITEQHQAAQRDAAMRNNAQNQPTVADSLRQRAQQVLMAKQVQAQQQAGLPQGMPQPQHQPEMGVDQLPANLGQHYDGGGIVAFSGGGGTLEEIEKAGIDKLKPLADKYKQEEAQFLAAAQSGDPQAIKLYMDAKEATRQDLESQVGKQFGNAAPRILGGLLAAAPVQTPNVVPVSETAPAVQAPATSTAQAPTPKPPAITDQEYQNALKILQSPTNKASFAKEINSRTDLSPEEKKSMIERYDNGWAQWEKVKKQWEAEHPPQPKPSALKPPAQGPLGLPGSPRVQSTAEPAQPAEAQDPLTAALEKQILGNLSVDKDAKARARRKETEQYLGLDTLAAAQRERAQKEYDMQKQQAQGRNAFSAFTAGINPYARTLAEGLRGGQQTLAAATAGWDKSDFEALQNYNKALSGIDTQTVAGKKFALEAEDTLFKDLSAEARNALTSGTSLVNTRENAAARKQAALDARLGREAAAKEGRLGREAAAKIAADQKAENAEDLRQKNADAAFARDPRVKAILTTNPMLYLGTKGAQLRKDNEDALARLRKEIYKQYKVTIDESPGAESPGVQNPGASAPSGWGNAQVVKQ